MCIRDRQLLREQGEAAAIVQPGQRILQRHTPQRLLILGALGDVCLLYTSDAADERSSVDLGGRRIIKKKNTVTTHYDTHTEQHSQQYAEYQKERE